MPALVTDRLCPTREGKLRWRVCLHPHLEQGRTLLVEKSHGCGCCFFLSRGCPGTLARHGAGEELGDLGHPSQGRESGRGSGLGQGGPPEAFLEGALPGERLEALEAVRSQALYGYLSVVSSCLKLSLSEWYW